MDVHAFLIRNAIAPISARWERSRYLRHYRVLRAAEFDTAATIAARQWRLLVNVQRHARATVPFYRERHAEILQIANIAHWRSLPILTKSDIRAAGPLLLSDAYGGQKLRRKTTSGSTGVSLEIFVDEDSMQWKRACTLRSDEWSGWRFGEPVAKVWGNPDYLRNGWRGRFRNAVLERATYLDTLRLTEESLASFAEQLTRQPLSLLFGHAHSLFLLADYLRAEARTTIRPRGIIATAMVLHDWQRRAIEQVFDCPVTNRYGCEEVSLIACECPWHRGMHVNSDSVFVEILKDGAPALPGETGHVVVTDLTNRAMPLIRYQVGDMAVATDRVCPCGRGMPLLGRIEGREADYVVTARGERISGISLTENFALEVPGIAQLQIVQEAVDQFTFRIVRAANFDDDSRCRLAELVRQHFGDAAFDCEFVDRIPPEKSGKYRFCISRVDAAFRREAECASP